MGAAQRRAAWGAAAAVGAVLAAAAWFIRWRAVGATAHPVAPATGDLVALFYPLMRHGFAELAAGRLPLWNPYQSCGEPFLANPSIGFFYPLYLPFLLLATAPAIDLDALLHLAIAAAGTAWLCRHLGIGWAGATVAGLVYAGHGSMLLKIPYPGFLAAVAWVPFLFLLVDRLLVRPTRRAAAALAAVLGVSLLGGNLQFTYFTAWALVPLAAVRLVQGRGRGRNPRAVGLLVVAVALAVGLALVRLLPGAELMRLSWRSPGSMTVQQAAIMSVAPRLFLAGLVSPPAAAASRLLLAHAYAAVYVGVVPLALALAGLGLWRRRATAAAIAAAGAAAAVYAFGTAGPLYPLLFALPGGNWFRAPDRALVIFGFAVAVLAGAGLDALGRAAGAGGRRPRAVVGLLAMAGVGVLVLAAGDPAGRLRLLAYAGLGGLALAARPYLRSRAAAGAVTAGLALLVLVDLGTAARPLGLMPSRLDAYLARNDDLFAAIRARQGLDRTYIWASSDPASPLYFFSDVAEAGLFHGIWMPTSYAGGIAGRRLERYLRELGPPPPAPLGWLPFHLTPANRALLDLMGVRFLVIAEGREGEQIDPAVAAELRPLRRDGGIALYENPRALPRAFVAETVRVVGDEDALLARMAGADLRREAFVEEAVALPPAGAPAPGGAAQVAITAYGAGAVSLEVDAPRPGLLVLTDQDYPGWRASVDGAPAPIHRADYLFRGIPIAAGRHRVELVYRPASLAVGAAGSAVALLAIAALALGGRRR